MSFCSKTKCLLTFGMHRAVMTSATTLQGSPSSSSSGDYSRRLPRLISGLSKASAAHFLSVNTGRILFILLACLSVFAVHILTLQMIHTIGIHTPTASLFEEEPEDDNLSVLAERVDSAITAVVKGVNHAIDKAFDIKRQKFYLTALICNRVFAEDGFNITAYECQQWIEYMLFAGVQHIYWYDSAHSDEESQALHLHKYVERGVMTYYRHHHLFPNMLDAGYHFEQDGSYFHFLTHHIEEGMWTAVLDVDEYPFMPSDQKKLFLRRFLENLQQSLPNVTQVDMPCMFFFGNPAGDLENDWLIERYQKRNHSAHTLQPGIDSRQKSIFQPGDWATETYTLIPHEFRMAKGATIATNPRTLRMNHYWGPRGLKFNNETDEFLATVQRDPSMQAIAIQIKNDTGLTNKTACLLETANAVTGCVNCRV